MLEQGGTPVVRRIDLPIVTPNSVPGYGAIFNAGLIHHDGLYHLFARGVRSGYRRNDSVGPMYLDYISDVLVFTSVNGIDYSFAYVLAKAGEAGVDCFEDPRVQLIHTYGNDHFVMTYTNLPNPEKGLPHHIGGHFLDYENKQFRLLGDTQRLGPPGVANKDGVLFNLSDGRVVLIQRIHPNMQIAVFDNLVQLWNADDEYWDKYMKDIDQYVLLRPSPDALGVGAGAPPILCNDGYMMFFHERDGSGAYNTQLALLDRHTGKIVSRLSKPILTPEQEWELHGDVDNVVFVQGVHLNKDEIYLTYGAADSCVAAATTSMEACLKALRESVDA